MTLGSEFTQQEKDFLEKFERETRLADERQSIDLMGCTNKYQFAKTCKMYAKDWVETRNQVLTKGSGGGLRREVVERMAHIGDSILEDKLKILGIHFKNTWHEPISNYLGNLTTLESLAKQMQTNAKEKESAVHPTQSSPDSTRMWLLTFLGLSLIVWPIILFHLFNK